MKGYCIICDEQDGNHKEGCPNKRDAANSTDSNNSPAAHLKEDAKHKAQP